MTAPESRARAVRLREPERRLLLVGGDILAALAGAAVALALWGRFDYLGPTAEFVRARATWFLFLPLLWPLFMVNLYDVHRAASWRDTVRGVILAAAGGAVMYLVFYFLQQGSLARRGILYFLASTTMVTLAWRALYIRIFTAPAFMRRVLIVGAGVGGRTLLKLYNQIWRRPFLLLGFIDDDREKWNDKIEGLSVLGGAAELLTMIDSTGATDLIVAIQGESGRPIFYRQARLGQGGRPYNVLKLRTMRQDAEADGQAHWTEDADPRTTRVGRLLRKVHLDEFPQFWNVLNGSMSLVGPRPERPELVRELEQKIPFYRARLLIKPGVTGWAQVNYGKGSSVEGSAEKLEFDLYYIKHRSLWMDLRIVLRTVGAVFGFRGV